MDDLSLEVRRQLPEELRLLARDYPPETWQGHANFDGLTAFWLERHAMFRELILRLIDGSERHLDRRDPRFGAEMARYTGFFLNQLHNHHMIEDAHYFPKLTALETRLERGFEILDLDHKALDGHIHDLAEHSNAVLAQLQAGEDEKPATGVLLAAQRDFRTFLLRHLEDEEELVVPVILKHGADME